MRAKTTLVCGQVRVLRDKVGSQLIAYVHKEKRRGILFMYMDYLNND